MLYLTHLNFNRTRSFIFYTRDGTKFYQPVLLLHKATDRHNVYEKITKVSVLIMNDGNNINKKKKEN